MTATASGHAFPRVGLLGNPSDIYGGKALAFAFDNFRASVQLRAAPPSLRHGAEQSLDIADFSRLAEPPRHPDFEGAAPLLLAREMHKALGADGNETGQLGVVINLLDQKLANLNPDFLTYTLSKAALATATELLARGLAPRIRVNAVSPGLTLPSLDQTAEEFADHARQNLLQRPVALADIAATVEHLLTTRSITGQNVFVDCGQRFLQRDGDVMFEGRERPIG